MTVATRRFRSARNLPIFAFSLLPLVVAGAAHAAGAPVLPTGGKVVTGQATIGAPTAGSLTVSQASGKAIINWNGFSIGSGGKVQINNGSGATLNRVTGTGVSSLNGLLSATGSVYLLNPNGVIVGRTGVVNVGGTFVASTLNVADANFMGGGDLAFTGKSNAAVVNLGKIGALGGDVALIAATVDNEGSVTAANGTAGLVSGYSVIMRDASLDEGMFSIVLGGANTGVTNGGAIIAANAELRAEGGNVYALAGNTAGVIRATGVKAGQGKVWLVADGGALDVAGTITAQGANGAGGAIETSGRNVTVGKASIDAHGGTWLVDPVDLTIDTTAATTIDASLNAGTSVTEQTTATTSSGAGTANADGNGDIIVAAPLSWATAAGLTLSAYRDVDVNATITSSGGGAVTLQADNAATGVGTVAFNGGGVSTAGATTILYNPTSYTTPTDFTADVTGGGTLAAYMLVNTAADLQNINTNLAGDYALNPGLGDGLDLSSIANFTPIGTDATPFTGVFTGDALDAPGNGEGTIANLTINLPNTISVGLFGNVGAGGSVENVALEGGSVTGFNAVGGLVGKNSGTVYGVDVDLDVTGNDAVGGVVGKNFANVTLAESGFINGATVTGQDYVGGVIGYNTVLNGSTAPSTAVASDVFSAAIVSGAGNYIGGIAGYNSAGSVIQQNLFGVEYLFESVTGTGATSIGVGGVAGYNAGTISGGETIEALVANTNGGVSTGGVVGLNDVGGVISGGLTEDSEVEGGNATGGIAGKNYGTVIGSETSGSDVAGADATGGIVGKNFSIVDGGQIVGGSTVEGVNYVGGVVGWNTTPSGSTAASTASVQDDSRAGASTQVTGTGNYIGGVVGRNDAGSVVTGSSQNGGLVQGPGAADEAIGGLVGYNAGTVSNSDTGAVVAETSANTDDTADYLGGMVGYNAAGGQISGVVTEVVAGFTAPYNGGLTNTVAGSFSDAGGLVGFNAGAISGSVATGTVTTTSGSSAAGGLVGINDTAGTIDSSSASGAVMVAAAANPLNSIAGGLVGVNNGAISNSSSTSTVAESGTSDGSSPDALGGLVGYNASGSTITASLASGTVTGQGVDDIGGLAGDNYGTITGASASGAVSLTNSSTSGDMGDAEVGGLVGLNYGAIGQAGAAASFATGAINVTVNNNTQGAYAGGLVGDNNSGGTITQAYASGAVTGSAGLVIVGGLAGSSDTGSSISYAYATGAVTSSGGGDAGGLVGDLGDATISQAWASGAVSGGSGGGFVGGVVGLNDGGSIANSVYWDQTTTGQTTAAGIDAEETGGNVDAASAVNTGGGALSPYAAASYPNLNFGAGGFVIFEGSTRPFLQSEETSTITNLHQLQLAALNPAGDYTVAADIDATPTNGANPADMWSTAGFSPIGTDATPFTGTFNGADLTSGLTHTITNLSIDTPATTSIGLFGNVGAGATVENVVLATPTITGFNAVGALAGKNSGEVSNITVTDGTITGNDAVGGVVGKNFGSVDYATTGGMTVTGVDYVGGVVGYNTVPFGSSQTPVEEVSYATASGTVSGSGSYVGGLVGYNDVGGAITSSSFIGTVESTGAAGVIDIGGVAGFNAGSLTGLTGVDTFVGTVEGGLASNVGGVAGYNSGTVGTVLVENSDVTDDGENTAGAASSFGGVVGLNAPGGLVTGAISAAEVETSANAVGGIVGKNYGSVTASQYGSLNNEDDEEVVRADINVSGDEFISGQDAVGGLVGKNSGAISNSIVYGGEVTGRAYVGGLVGWNTSPTGAATTAAPTISATSAYNEVLGQSDVGGLVGRNDAVGTISGSWADGTVFLQNYDDSDVFGPIGGLVGYNAGTITTSYSGASVSDNDVGSNAAIVMGGLIGENAGTVSDVYSIGSVLVSNENDSGYTVGGLVGQNDAGATITRGYASGALGTSGGKSGIGAASSIDGTVGAVAGTNAGTLSNIYFDQSTTTEYNAVGSGSSTGTTRVGGSSNDPYAQATYAGFDFGSTWYIIDGSTRPFLQSEYSTTISNAHQLQLISLNLGATYTLAGDIDASATSSNPSDIWRNALTSDANGNYGFVPIGTDASPFTGALIGGENFIEGLTTVKPTSTSVGLFGNIGATAFVDGVGLDGSTTVGLNAVGSLAGKNSGAVLDDTVEESSVQGSGGVGGVLGKNFGSADYIEAEGVDVTGNGTYVGGLVGYNGVPQGSGATTQAALSNGESIDGEVTDTAANQENDVGGLVGYSDPNAVVVNSVAENVDVTGAGYAVGGLVGKNYGGVTNSFIEEFDVTGAAAVGGAVGKNFGAVAFDSATDGTVSGAQYVGGLVGYNGVPQGSGSTTPATIFNSYSGYAVEGVDVFGTATTNAEADVGGLAGFNDAFGQITDIAVEDVVVQGAAVAGTGGAAYGGYAVGGVVGKNYGLIDNASALDQVTTGSAAVGGIVGKNFGTVEFTTADGSVTGDQYVGGLVGYNGVPQGSGSTTPAVVTESLFNFGTVSGNGVTGASSEADVGGLVGYNDTFGQVSFSATGTDDAVTVTSTGNAVGGAVGKNYGSLVQLAVAGGSVTGQDSVGGLVGRNFGAVSQGLTEASVTGADYVGGAIGYSGTSDVGSATSATVDQVVAFGPVNWSGASGTGIDFGGLIGLNSGSVTNAYSEGAVENMTGMTNIGGFVGYNTGSVATSYTISALTTPMNDGAAGTPGTNAGAFAGNNAGTFTSDYYDLAENPGDTVPGVATGNLAGLVGLTDAQAMTQSSYQGFDFVNIWTINPNTHGGYPYLQAEIALDNFLASSGD